MSKFWVVDDFNFHMGQKVFDLTDDTFYLALVDSSLDSNYLEWAEETEYSLGDIVIPTVRNGHRYICITAGETGTTEPTWTDTEDETFPGAEGEPVFQEYGGDMCDLSLWSEVSASEVANGNGYTTNGAALASKTLVPVGKTTTWDAADVTFTALTKTFRTGWIYKSGTDNSIVNPLVGYILFDDDFADKEISGIDFWIQMASTGIYTWNN